MIVDYQFLTQINPNDSVLFTPQEIELLQKQMVNQLTKPVVYPHPKGTVNYDRKQSSWAWLAGALDSLLVLHYKSRSDTLLVNMSGYVATPDLSLINSIKLITDCGTLSNKESLDSLVQDKAHNNRSYMEYLRFSEQETEFILAKTQPFWKSRILEFSHALLFFEQKGSMKYLLEHFDYDKELKRQRYETLKSLMETHKANYPRKDSPLRPKKLQDT